MKLSWHSSRTHSSWPGDGERRAGLCQMWGLLAVKDVSLGTNFNCFQFMYWQYNITLVICAKEKVGFGRQGTDGLSMGVLWPNSALSLGRDLSWGVLFLIHLC